MYRINLFSYLIIVLVTLLISSCEKEKPAMSPNCNDGILNQDETDIDCGGLCEPCFFKSSIEGECADLINHPTMLYLKENSWDGYCIMKRYLEKCSPTTNISGNVLTNQQYLEYFFRDATEFNDSLRALSVLVHEATHSVSYSNLFKVLKGYFDCDRTIDIDVTNTFPSNELTAVIDENHRTFRFDTYVIGLSEIQSTQTKGVYGLLNELNAYYMGSRTQYDFKAKYTNNSIGRIFSGMQAYYEFKYFILTYLLYAKENHPQVYLGIVNNTAFKEAFNTINKSYEELTKQYIADGNQLPHSPTNQNLKNVIDKLGTMEYFDQLEALK